MEILIRPFDRALHYIQWGLLPYFPGYKDDLSCIGEPKSATLEFPNAPQVLYR